MLAATVRLPAQTHRELSHHVAGSVSKLPHQAKRYIRNILSMNL